MKKNIKIWFIVLLPAIIFLVSPAFSNIIKSIDIGMLYYPVSFGLIIGIVNWKTFKHSQFLMVLLSLMVSIITFLMAYYSMAAFGYIREFLLSNTNIVMSDDNARELAFIISPFVIAPILVFLAYKFVFNYPKTKITLLIVLFSILLLVLQSCYFFFIAKPIDEANLFLNPYTIWQVIMALALQLIIYQTKIFKSNKN